MVERHRQERADIFRGSWRGKGALLNALPEHRSRRARRRRRPRCETGTSWSGLPSTRARALSRPMNSGWPPGPTTPPTSGATGSGVPRRSRDRPSKSAGAARHPRRPAPSSMGEGQLLHGRARGAPSFTDRGKTIDIHDSRSRESVLAALQLSAQKWGAISVRGDDNSSAPASSWRPSTASRSRTQSFNERSPPNESNGPRPDRESNKKRLSERDAAVDDARRHLPPAPRRHSQRAARPADRSVEGGCRGSSPNGRHGPFS